MALEPEKLGDKVEEVYRTDANEATKLENLLNLLFKNKKTAEEITDIVVVKEEKWYQKVI